MIILLLEFLLHPLYINIFIFYVALPNDFSLIVIWNKLFLSNENNLLPVLLFQVFLSNH